MGDDVTVGPVVAFVPDMIDRSRLAAAAAAAGRTLELVRTPGELAERAGSGAVLCLLDLARPGVVEILPSLAGMQTVGFASHVERDLISRARAAGCGRVLARSAFFGSLGDLLRLDA